MSLKDISPEKTMLYIFNVGHSGAKLSQLRKGTTSMGYTIWQRAIKDQYGFATIYFKDQIFDFKFFERKNGKIINTATINLRDTDTQPDQNSLGALIKSNFCK